MLLTLVRANFLLVSLIVFIPKNTFGQNKTEIYTINDSDSSLTTAFINAVCEAVISQAKSGNKYELERLIINASQHLKPDSAKSLKWHSRFGNECICPSTKDYKQMNFLRLVVLSNFRDFANHIGPKNRLPLDFELKDNRDSLNIYDFVNNLRKDIEAEHNDKRFEFQQDGRWRNLMFFYFLFSEFYLKQY